MPGETTLLLIRLFAVFVAVSIVVSLVSRRIPLPHSVVLVGCGLVAGLFVHLSEAEIPPELVLLVLLPGLIFEASYKLDLRILVPALPAVVLLAVPGVFVTGIVVALALHLGAGMDLGVGFVVGAILSATDPVAVIATFRSLGAPRRLATTVEAESVFNDGTGIVVFSIAAAALVQPVSIGSAAAAFALAVLVSATIGLLAGEIGVRVMIRLNDRVLELAVSLLIAYGTYLMADAVHQSGVIATAIAGIVLGNEGRRRGLGPATFEALDVVWEFLAYLLTTLVFLLIGLAIPAPSLVGAMPAIAWAILGVLIARAVLVYGGVGALRMVAPAVRSRTPPAWLHVIFWSGLRGAIAVALALSLSPGVPSRTTIQEIAFGVVLFTLAIQATTADVLLRRLGLGPGADGPASRSAAPGTTTGVPG